MIPLPIVKLRWGWAHLFEQVRDVEGFMPGRKVLKVGRIWNITRNTGRRRLRHFPEDEMCLKVRWQDGSTEWVTADWFLRSEETDGEFGPGIVRIL
jgi:hypothetical protein